MLSVGTGTATAQVTGTHLATVVMASTVNEGSGASYAFTATLSNASEGVTTIHTDQGDISIADGATTGTLTIASGNGEDVYTDASSLTAHITGVSGGNFELLSVGSGTATANVTSLSPRPPSTSRRRPSTKARVRATCSRRRCRMRRRV